MSIKTTRKERDHKWRYFLGGVICLSLSIIGFWAAFCGEDIEGGIPFIAEATNQLIGRVVFGIGAVFTGLLAVVAFRELVGSDSK